MFICPECAIKNLSNNAFGWPFSQSFGVCEFCDKTAICRDVPSNNPGWWKTVRSKRYRKPMKKAKPVETWTYSTYRAALKKNGRTFALVSLDGRSPLPEKEAKELLAALNK